MHYKRSKNSDAIFFLIPIIVSIILFASTAKALSSANYTILPYSINIGGTERANSSSYNLSYTLGEISCSLSSASYKLSCGFQSGLSEARPDIEIPPSTVTINPSTPETGDSVNITFLISNIGNASTGGGVNSIRATCYVDATNVSEDFVDALGPAPPVNSSWANCTWIPSDGGTIRFNISALIMSPPNKLEWNYTNNNYTTLVTVVQRYANVSWITGNQTVDRGSLNLVARVLRNNTATAINNYPCSFYRNGTLIANALTNSTGHCSTTWNTQTLAVGDYNVTVNISDNATLYYDANPSANQASIFVTLRGTLSVTLNNPANQSSHARGSTVDFRSIIDDENDAVVDSASVNWYNATRLILSTQNGSYTIPAGHQLGTQQFKIEAAKTFYTNGSVNFTLTINNAVPQFVGPTTNVTDNEVELPNDIRVNCTVTDVETAVTGLTVNISIKDPNGVWDNITITTRDGSIFYRDYNLNTTSPLGTYTSQCSALDGESGFNISATRTFLAFQNGTIEIKMNTSEAAWNEPINISILALRNDSSVISSGSTSIKINPVLKCSGTTNSSGRFACIFNVPNAIGDFVVLVEVTDPSTDKVISNTTVLNVSVGVGQSKTEKNRARDAGCYDTPRLIQNPDGSVTTVIVRVCVWK